MLVCNVTLMEQSYKSLAKYPLCVVSCIHLSSKPGHITNNPHEVCKFITHFLSLVPCVTFYFFILHIKMSDYIQGYSMVS